MQFIKSPIGLGPGFYMCLKSINKKKRKCILEYIKCFSLNLVFYINFACIYSHDLKYPIKIGKKNQDQGSCVHIFGGCSHRKKIAAFALSLRHQVDISNLGPLSV